MKIAPYMDQEGIARKRERAPYRVALVSEGGHLHLVFLPEGEGLTCLEYARIFSLALRSGTDPQQAREFGEWLLAHLEGLDAVYDPEHDPRPTYPNVVPLWAA